MLRKLRTSLIARVMVLTLMTGVVVFFGLLFIFFLVGVAGGPHRHPHWLPPLLGLMSMAVIILGIPLLIGLLVSRLIKKPLRAFDRAITSLQTSDYKTQLKSAGIAELDRVFASFNTLTKRLQEEESLRKDLISDTSHELNTPLAAMAGQLTAMQEGKLPMTKERIALVKEQADRLMELVDGLDAYTRARMPHGNTGEDVRLKAVCEELIAGLSLALQEKGIETELHISDQLVVHAERTVLRQIILNLLQNALRYSEATKITITADARGLQFSDNGKGVPVSSLPYLFERFYRVEKSRNRATGGLGLGLAIVKELVQNQGWKIEAVLLHPGLRFVITFKP